jgi:L-amino acid N-acyltransferase YncA
MRPSFTRRPALWLKNRLMRSRPSVRRPAATPLNRASKLIDSSPFNHPTAHTRFIHMLPITVRASQPEDLDTITAIYAHHVLHGTGTFETEPPTLADMTQRRADVLGKQLPYLVAVQGTQVLGFAYGNWFKPRPAYRFSVEDSVYVAPGQQGNGVGKLLMTALLSHLQACGIRHVMAVIGDADNAGSIGLHKAMGFVEAGRMHACGWKFERWLDIVLMERTLGDGNTTAPTP